MEIFGNVTFWVFVSFVAFFGLLIYLKVPKMITGLLDERADMIRKEIEEAAQLREDAQSILADYQRKQREAEKEAEEIVAQAKEEAALLKAETEKTLHEQIERRTKLAEDKIAQAEAQAVADVKNTAASAAAGAARRLLKDNLDDALRVDFSTALDREAERLVETAGHPDHREAVRAFIEKRAPNFGKDDDAG